VISQKSTKGWSTAGPQENREQARSYTLPLVAAEETEDSQPAQESTVFLPHEMGAYNKEEASLIHLSRSQR